MTNFRSKNSGCLYDDKPTFQRLLSWPNEFAFSPVGKMRIPFPVRFAGISLRLLSLFPSFASYVGYRLFFYINPVARNSTCGLKPLKAEVSWLRLHTHDGTADKSIRCFQMGSESNPIVVLVHGWESTVERMADMADKLVESGYQVLLFDLPAHGKSDGKHTDLLEINAVIRGMLARQKEVVVGRDNDLDMRPCVAIVAHSFGGVCALKLLSDGAECEKLVLVSTPGTFSGVFEKFSYLLNLSKCMQTKIKSRISARFESLVGNVWQRFCPQNNIPRLDQSILIIHDEKDKVVPISEAKLLFEMAEKRVNKECKQELMITSSCGHSRILTDARVIENIVDFISHNRKSSRNF